jgi:proteasome lid subunit RPN8/RPN11
MSLWLTHDQARAIAVHAREEAPREACGLIVGANERAVRIVSIPNAAADPLHHYEMETTAFVRAMFAIQRERLQLIGIYHSHPRTEPVPSRVDLTRAAYPDVAYVIVSLRGDEPQFAAWRMRGHRVERADLHIDMSPPPPAPARLSSAGKAAVIAALVLAVVFLIVLSLALLPPAPPIP